MKISLEKACIGFLIGVLLFCVCNKMFLIEGVGEGVGEGEVRCDKKTDVAQVCPDGTHCDAIKGCDDPRACLCPTPPPSGKCVCTRPIIPENPLACRDVGNNPNNPKPNIKKTVCTLRRTSEDCENITGHQNVTKGTCKWETSSPSPQK